MADVSKESGLVTNSSTETEVVSNGERAPKCSWFRYFRTFQGVDESKEDILMQDNESCMLLHNNYPHSDRKGSKNAHVRRFFVVDKINKREVKPHVSQLRR